MVAPAAKREAVAHLQTTLGMRRAAGVHGRRGGSHEHAISFVPG